MMKMGCWKEEGGKRNGGGGRKQKKGSFGKREEESVIRDFGNLASGNGEIRSLFSFRLPRCSNRRRCSFHEWLFAFGKEERNLLL